MSGEATIYKESGGKYARVTQQSHADQAVAVYVTQSISNPPTQAEVQAVDAGLVTAVRLSNQLRSDLIALGLILGS